MGGLDRATWLVIGSGGIARRHVANLRQLAPHCRVLMLKRRWDSSSVQQLGADEVLSDLDAAIARTPCAAIVANPAPFHIADAMQLARAGIPALIEKPLAPSVADVVPLIELQQQGLLSPIMVAYCLRFLPSMRHCKQLLDAGKIGRILSARLEVGQYLPDWRPDLDYRRSVSARRDLGGGALLELSHELDYCRWLLGSPTHCFATVSKLSDLDMDVEDTAELLLRGHASSGEEWMASIHLDMCQRTAVRTCRIVGSNGTLFWDGIAGCVKISTTHQPEWRDDFRAIAGERNQMYLDELTTFMKCIDGSGTPQPDVEDAMRTLQLVDAARESAAKKCEISIHY